MNMNKIDGQNNIGHALKTTIMNVASIHKHKLIMCFIRQLYHTHVMILVLCRRESELGLLLDPQKIV